jgi:hypothetical protein
MMRFFCDFSRGATNQHGTQKDGEPWNKQTVKGPMLKFLKLRRKSAGISWRFIFYFPSGACWYFDLFSKLKVSS